MVGCGGFIRRCKYVYENPKILKQHRICEPMTPVHPESTPGLVRVPDPRDLPTSSDESTMPNIRSPQDETYQPSTMQETMLQVRGGLQGFAFAAVCRSRTMCFHYVCGSSVC